jgi:hypothetical protein
MKKDLSPVAGRDNRNFRLFGRLADSVTLEQAQAEAGGIANQLANAYPEVDKRMRDSHRCSSRSERREWGQW